MFTKKEKPQKKSVASTHLICGLPDSVKYFAALNWCLPVVSMDWLTACLTDWTWVSEKPFLVGKSQSFTPGKPLPSDETRSAKRSIQMDGGDIPDVKRKKRSIEESEEEKHKSRKKARVELERCREAGQRTGGALAGVVLLVAKKLSSESPDLHKIVERLGGKSSLTLGPSVTHFVFRGRPNDLSKELRRAKQQNCLVVSPDWVYSCRDQDTRVEESAFPHTLNPKMKLNLSPDKTVSRTRSTEPNKSLLEEKVNDSDDYDDDEDGTVTGKSFPPGKENLEDGKKDSEEGTQDLAVLNNLLGSINKTPVSQYFVTNDCKPLILFRPLLETEARGNPPYSSQLRTSTRR